MTRDRVTLTNLRITGGTPVPRLPKSRHLRAIVTVEQLSAEQHEDVSVRHSPVEWCPRRDSNPEPTDYESAALTVELQGHKSLLTVV